MASSSSSRKLKYQVFLSFRGEDTRLSFTAFLLRDLKARGMNVFFDEEKLEKGEQLSQALSQAIEASSLSIVVLSVDYASSKSCLAELSHIMVRKRTQGHIVLPIFYHVDPSDVRNIGGSFKRSFDDHESKRLDQVQRWKAAFAEIGKLKGWHIEGGKFDRPETDYIRDMVQYVVKKLMNSYSRNASEELVGRDDQKKAILDLDKQEDSRVIGLWGMGGIGKTALADAVYKEGSPNFEDHYYLQNVSEKIEKQGMESLRNELLSKLLDEKEIFIDTPSIGYPYTQRLNNKKVMVVLDDVVDPDLIDYMGVKYFGNGSKVIVTSRDRQVLKNGGADKIHEVKKLNWNDSLQLFSTFAFKQLNPAANFLDLSNKFVEYAQGNPLALKVLGSHLYTKSRKYWESEVDILKEYLKPKISQILKRSFDVLDELEKNIFLDIACFFKSQSKEDVQEILSCLYNGAVCGISNLVDKCLIDIRISFGGADISMHDLLEEMGKDIVRQESKGPGMRSRLWSPKDVYQVLRHNKGTESIEGIKLDISQIDNLQLCPTVFESMLNLKYIQFYFASRTIWTWETKKLLANVDSVSLPDELKYLWWEYCPLKSLSSFNPKNLVILKLPHGDMEQLWNEDDHQDLVNLREIDVFYCKKLSKISNLSAAINLKSLICTGCESLVILPCLNHLTSLEKLKLFGCYNLKKFPEVPCNMSFLHLGDTGIEEVPDSVEHLVRLDKLWLINSMVKNVSNNISKLESLRFLNFSHCLLIAEFPKFPVEILTVDVPSSILRFKSLVFLKMDFCKSLKLLWELPPYLRYLTAHDCTSLEKVSFIDQNRDLYEFHSFDEDDFLDDDDGLIMLFSNCFNLNQDSIDNIEANAMLKIGSLAKTWASKYVLDRPRLMCSFPGNIISENKFEYQSINSSLILKIAPNGGSGSRFLVFAICLVADLTPNHGNKSLKFICEYQLTTACGGGYEKFIKQWYELDFEADRQCMGCHVLILFNGDMTIKDKDYEEASFEFYIKSGGYSIEVPEIDIKVEKCGVHVFYVDAEISADSDVESYEKSNISEMSNDEESYANSDVESSEKSDFNEMSNDESDDSFYSADDGNFEEVDDDTQKQL